MAPRPDELPFERIEESRIDPADRSFRIRARYAEALPISIQRIGIQTPLLVQPTASGRLRLVSGWGRWLCRPEGRALPCFVLPEDLSAEEAWDVFLRDNERYNVIEIARVLRALSEVPGLDEERTVRERLPLLGVHPSGDLYRRYLRLADLPADVQSFVEEENVPLGRTEILFRFPLEATRAVVATVRELRPTWSELGEILELLDEISRRDGLSPEVALRRVLSSATDRVLGSMGRPDKARFRKELRACRYPELTEYTSRLERLRELLRFSVPVRVDWDPSLERPGIRISAELREPGSPGTLERELRSNRKVLEAFLEIL